MKTELKADKGTPAPMARNPAACRPETTVRYGYHPRSGVHEKYGEISFIEQTVGTLVCLRGIDDAVLVPVEEGDVPLQRRQLAFVHVRHGRGGGGGVVAPWCSPSSKLKRGARWLKPTPHIKNMPSRGTFWYVTFAAAASWDCWEIDLPGVVSAGLAAMEAVRSLTRPTSERCAALVPISGGAGGGRCRSGRTN